MRRRRAYSMATQLKRQNPRLGIEGLESRWYLHGDCLDTEQPELDEWTADPIPGETDSATIQASSQAAAAQPLSSIPKLNSLPGAAVSVFLDFDGHFDATWGSNKNITTPAYDQDGDPTTFSDAELTSITNIWKGVAEDYAPFKVNVTTVEPPSIANGVALLVAIGGDGAWTGGSYGGIAYINSFTNSSSNTCFVFPKNLGNGFAKYVADASAHEAGHGFGLQHQSQYDANGAKVADYYSGPGNGTAPIMGNSYSATRSLWWNGTSTSATTIQDDVSVISRSQNGFGYRTDDHGNTVSTATPLSVNGNQLSGSGIIATTADQDFFSFSTGAGQISVSANVLSYNDLDTRIELRDAGGALIASAAPSNSFNATITSNVAAGSYRLVVASNGNYGDVGQYTVGGTIVAAAAAPSSVVGRRLFYKGSAWDDTNADMPGFSDDNAIASDKTAYLPGGGTSGFSAVSSYHKGINGLMVDLSGPHGAIAANDFIFKVGNNNSPNLWATAPAPTLVTVRSGAGAGGSDRVELFWADNAIANTWLEVVVRGDDALGSSNTDTGLDASDVFFFGSAVGDTGAGNTTTFGVNSADEIAIRNDPHPVGDPAVITNPHDLNRDLIVNSTDQIIARNNVVAAGNQLKFLVVGAGGPFAPQMALSSTDQKEDGIASAATILESILDDPGDAGIASALAAVRATGAIVQPSTENGSRAPFHRADHDPLARTTQAIQASAEHRRALALVLADLSGDTVGSGLDDLLRDCRSAAADVT
jgi:hypothetical protein